MNMGSSMHGGGGMDMGGGGSCKISMLWNWYTIDACFLAEGWHIRNRGMFAVTCIGVALMTVILEALRRACREYDLLIVRQWRSHAEFVQTRFHQQQTQTQVLQSNSINKNKLDDNIEEDGIESTPASGSNSPNQKHLPLKPFIVQNSSSITFRATPIQQLIRAILHASTFGLAYILMLLVMYFNGYIIISIILGAGIGKFVCDWMTQTISINSTDCQKVDDLGFGQRLRNNEEPAVCC